MKKTINKNDFDDFVNKDFQNPQSTPEASMDEPIAGLPISTRVWRVLRQLGVERVGDLVKLTERDLKNTEGLGNRSIKEIKTLIGEMNLTLHKPERAIKQK
jgi:DNA-directed RNA polymerase alpha subunit